MNFGENVRKQREELDMTQLQLATAVGVTDPMISQIERGTKNATVNLAVSIAQALHCTLNKLVYGTDCP